MDAPVPLEFPDCLLCGGDEFRTLLTGLSDQVWYRPGTFQIQRCGACGLIMTRPRPTAEGLNFYYDNAYSGGDQAIGIREFYESPVGRLLNNYRLVTIAKVRPLSADDRVLDVGCSYGNFLAQAREKTGCAAHGIDLDAGSIAEAANREEIDYTVGFLRTAGFDPRQFTVITFYQCLEHEAQPVETLRAAWEALEPGGLVVVEVPNYRSFWRPIFRRSWLPLFIPQHLVHFEPETLKATLGAAGFAVVHHQSMLYPVEAAGSLAIIFNRVFGPKPPDGGSFGRRCLDLTLKIITSIFFWLVDSPSQFWLRIAGYTGHQTIIGQRPLDETAPARELTDG